MEFNYIIKKIKNAEIIEYTFPHLILRIFIKRAFRIIIKNI